MSSPSKGAKAPPKTTKELRKFGLAVGGTLCVLGAISFWRGHTYPPLVLWTIGAPLFLCGLVVPGILGPVERGWMKLAGVLGYVNTRIILTIVYYLVILPIGVLMRTLKGDPLDRGVGDGRPSNWVKRETQPVDPARYHMQF